MDTTSVFLILSCLLLLGSSRLRVAIRVVAVQGVLVGLLPLVRSEGDLHLHIWILAVVIIATKGFVLPWLMSVALRRSRVHREIEPFIGFGASILCGVALLALSLWITASLQLTGAEASGLLLTTAFFLVLTGLFLMVSRRKAITQSLAYLVMENGVYVVGIGMSLESPFLVELGILLDVSVGLFIMGNLLFHLDREFDHLDADKLTELSDSSGSPDLISEARE